MNFDDPEYRNAVQRARETFSTMLSAMAADYRTTGDTLRACIADEMTRPAFAGANPANVARKLRHKFDLPKDELFALVQSIGQRGQVLARLRSLLEQGETHYDIDCAPDACRHCKALAANGPYRIESGVIPPPHGCKFCRCSIRPKL